MSIWDLQTKLKFQLVVWCRYSLSYIPFARSIVSKVMTSCFDTDF
jgi:predicted ABC-class ATPase